MEKMNKTQLVDALAEKSGVTKADATRVLDSFVEVVGDTLAEGGEIALVGFGTFKTSARKARTGRNPKTGEEIQIAEANVPAFKAGKGLKDKVNK